MTTRSAAHCPFSHLHPCMYHWFFCSRQDNTLVVANRSLSPRTQLSHWARHRWNILSSIFRDIWTKDSVYYIHPNLLYRLCDCSIGSLPGSYTYRSFRCWYRISCTDDCGSRQHRRHLQHSSSCVDNIHVGLGRTPRTGFGTDIQHLYYLHTWVVSERYLFAQDIALCLQEFLTHELFQAMGILYLDNPYGFCIRSMCVYQRKPPQSPP